jgi:hypothetical protein
MTIAIAGALTGAVFGFRCQLFDLVTVILLSVIVLIAMGLMTLQGGWSIAIHSLLVAVMLQIGYLGGGATSFALGSARKFALGRRHQPRAAADLICPCITLKAED